MKQFLMVMVTAIIFSVSVFSPLVVSAQSPFGGPIVFIRDWGPGRVNSGLCQEARWLKVKQPGKGVVDLMYSLGGSRSYSYGPPRRYNQQLLGQSAGFLTCTILFTCGTAVCAAVIGGGQLILYHGSNR